MTKKKSKVSVLMLDTADEMTQAVLAETQANKVSDVLTLVYTEDCNKYSVIGSVRTTDIMNEMLGVGWVSMQRLMECEPPDDAPAEASVATSDAGRGINTIAAAWADLEGAAFGHEPSAERKKLRNLFYAGAGYVFMRMFGEEPLSQGEFAAMYEELEDFLAEGRNGG